MSITSANIILNLTVIPIFPVAQRIQGFSPDDMFDAPNVETAINQMGVDGVKTSAYIYAQKEMTISLMGDSKSAKIMNAWKAAEDALIDKLPAYGEATFPSLGMKYILVNGTLSSAAPMPTAKKNIQNLTYKIVWEKIIPTTL